MPKLKVIHHIHLAGLFLPKLNWNVMHDFVLGNPLFLDLLTYDSVDKLVSDDTKNSNDINFKQDCSH